MASGGLDIISDESLRSSLAAWPSAVAEYSEQEQYVVAWIMASTPVFASRLPLDAIAPIDFTVGGMEPSMLPKMTADTNRFLDSSEGRSYVATRKFYEEIAVVEGRVLFLTVEAILVALDQSLGGQTAGN